MNSSNKTVAEIMTTKVIALKKDNDIDEAISIMVKNDISYIPVVEGDNLIGIVSDRDVRVAFACDPFINSEESDPLQACTKVMQIMTRNPKTISPDTNISSCARMFYENNVGALPVVRDGNLIGIISTHDLLKELFN